MATVLNRHRRESRGNGRVLVCVFAYALIWSFGIAHAALPQTAADVQRALDYQMPVHACIAPDLRPRSDRPGQAERYAQQYRRYVLCIQRYQHALFADLLLMQKVADRGVTTPQLAAIRQSAATIAAQIKAMRTAGEAIQQRWQRITGERHSVDMPGDDAMAGDRMLNVKM